MCSSVVAYTSGHADTLANCLHVKEPRRNQDTCILTARCDRVNIYPPTARCNACALAGER